MKPNGNDIPNNRESIQRFEEEKKNEKSIDKSPLKGQDIRHEAQAMKIQRSHDESKLDYDYKPRLKQSFNSKHLSSREAA